ncbi:hypothetical protein [Streptacidiphilus sp. BW17]|uniref:acyl-CoA carboxylase epsilon subunit n=1 Tax=Streptacidiphilus sp. BW17 TaxID=3156274 RepID=UPI0035124F57
MSDHAYVGGHASVSDHAYVGGHASVSDHAYVGDDSLRIERGQPSAEEVAVLAALLTLRQTQPEETQSDAGADGRRPGRGRARWKSSGSRQPGGWGAP